MDGVGFGFEWGWFWKIDFILDDVELNLWRFLLVMNRVDVCMFGYCCFCFNGFVNYCDEERCWFFFKFNLCVFLLKFEFCDINLVIGVFDLFRRKFLFIFLLVVRLKFLLCLIDGFVIVVNFVLLFRWFVCDGIERFWVDYLLYLLWFVRFIWVNGGRDVIWFDWVVKDGGLFGLSGCCWDLEIMVRSFDLGLFVLSFWELKFIIFGSICFCLKVCLIM